MGSGQEKTDKYTRNEQLEGKRSVTTGKAWKAQRGGGVKRWRIGRKKAKSVRALKGRTEAHDPIKKWRKKERPGNLLNLERPPNARGKANSGGFRGIHHLTGNRKTCENKNTRRTGRREKNQLLSGAGTPKKKVDDLRLASLRPSGLGGQIGAKGKKGGT